MVAPIELQSTECFYLPKHVETVHAPCTDDLGCDLSSTTVPGTGSRSLLGQHKTILLGLLALALGPPTTLDSLGLRFVDVVRRNPAFIICFRARGNSRSIGSNNRDLVGGIDFL